MKIAVIRFSALGDIAASLPVLRALKYKPTIITTNIGKELLKDEFDDFIILENKKLITVLKLILKLRQEKFDLIIDLQGNDRTKFITKFSNAKEFVNSNGVSFNQRATFIFRDIVKKSSFDVIDNLDNTFIKKDKTYIVLNCGSSPKWESKRLPFEKWREISILLKEKFDLPIYLTGDKSEIDYINELSKHLVGDIVNKCGKTNIQELKKLLSKAYLTISTDSASMHISAVQKTPTIGLFGPTNWIVSAPYGLWSYVVYDKTYFSDDKPLSKNSTEIDNYFSNINISNLINKMKF